MIGKVGYIKDMDEEHGSLHMFQKPCPQAATLVGILDETRYICNDKTLEVVVPDDPQIRRGGCEGIVCNLRLGRRDLGNEGGFSSIWKTDEAHVCAEL